MTTLSESRPTRWRRLGPTAVVVAVGALVVVVEPAAPALAGGVTCRGERATIVGTAASEVIHGTPGRDVIAGLGGNDTILAGGGADLVCGGGGADHVDGGAGRDRLFGGRDLLHRADEDGIERVGDTLRGGPGNDRLDGGVDRRHADLVSPDVYAWDQSAHGVHIDLRSRTARGEGADTFAAGDYSVVASAYDDVVDGSHGRDRIDTGRGRDVVRAHGGADIVVADDLHRGSRGEGDRVWGGRGADHITAAGGHDQLSGGTGKDWIEVSGKGNDVIRGGSGDDSIYAEVADSSGPQVIEGGAGTDFLQLNSDVINGSGAASTGTWHMATGVMEMTVGHEIGLSVGHIEQAILATAGTGWTVTGTGGDDVVAGDTESVSSPVTFYGRAGDDSFRGTEGDDLFDGGPGRDSASMWGGDDTCISVEVIDDFGCDHVS